jgi:hypothetical protein
MCHGVRCVTRVLGQRPNSRGSTPQVCAATRPNTSNKETSSAAQQRKEVYYEARAHHGEKQSKHFSPSLGYRREL